MKLFFISITMLSSLVVLLEYFLYYLQTLNFSIFKKINKFIFKNQFTSSINFKIINSFKRKVVWIQEDNCIGCTKCISVCPVDAIVGARGCIHTVLSNFCIGCNLCIKICPSHCIEIHSTDVIVNIVELDNKIIPIKLDVVYSNV
ncbi:MAG: RnfABCDGE type electron transport complex subunit B [Pantoea sp. Brub]|nr:RnfABCDGE type electron transport complex subunit B [Pantoea sp. Brub]